ncbi:MAG: tetratricopeptide repeat protein [Hyphomonadaceae bacterium]|nr:tetratricopeptide repeat protein [Hyphomonadaceae bacterium]
MQPHEESPTQWRMLAKHLVGGAIAVAIGGALALGAGLGRGAVDAFAEHGLELFPSVARQREWEMCVDGVDPQAKAVACLARAQDEAESSADRATAYLNRGNAHMDLDDPSAAVNDYMRALELDQSHPSANARLAIALLALGDTEQAAVSLARATARAPESYLVLKVRGMLLFHEGRYADADAQFAWIVENLARLDAQMQTQRDRDIEANRPFTPFNATLLHPHTEASLRLWRSISLLAAGDARGAARQYRRAAQHWTHADEELLHWCARGAYQSANSEATRLLCSGAMEFVPNDLRSRIHRGMAALRGSDFPAAFADFDAVVQRAQAPLDLRAIDLGEAEWNEVEHLISHNSNLALALHGRGLARQRLNQIQAGEADIAQASLQYPEAAAYFRNAGLSLPSLAAELRGAQEDSEP